MGWAVVSGARVVGTRRVVGLAELYQFAYPNPV